MHRIHGNNKNSGIRILEKILRLSFRYNWICIITHKCSLFHLINASLTVMIKFSFSEFYICIRVWNQLLQYTHCLIKHELLNIKQIQRWLRNLQLYICIHSAQSVPPSSSHTLWWCCRTHGQGWCQMAATGSSWETSHDHSAHEMKKYRKSRV